MRILQLNCVYQSGSTGKIVNDIGMTLREMGHDVLTCYAAGNKHYDDYSVKICTDFEHNLNALFGRISGIPFGGLYWSNIRAKEIIRTYHPDIVHVHCINGYMINVYSLLKFLARNHIKTVVTLHAEIFHTAGCSHAYECEKWKDKCHNCEVYKREIGSWFFDRSADSWQKMYNAFNAFDDKDIIITAVSPWLTERAKQSGILKRFRVVCVPNGLDTSIFYHRECKGLINRENFEKIILFVTPILSTSETDIKGGRFLPLLSKEFPDYKFIVVSSRMDSILGEMPSNVQLWGKAKSQDELAQLYSEADITLLLSRRETFSMVTAESLCCGTPVVGFKAGGPESIAIKEASWFAEYGDTCTMAEFIRNQRWLISKDWLSEESMKTFSSQYMAKEYIKTFNNLTQKLKQ